MGIAETLGSIGGMFTKTGEGLTAVEKGINTVDTFFSGLKTATLDIGGGGSVFGEGFGRTSIPTTSTNGVSNFLKDATAFLSRIGTTLGEVADITKAAEKITFKPSFEITGGEFQVKKTDIMSILKQYGIWIIAFILVIVLIVIFAKK